MRQAYDYWQDQPGNSGFQNATPPAPPDETRARPLETPPHAAGRRESIERTLLRTRRRRGCCWSGHHTHTTRPARRGAVVRAPGPPGIFIIKKNIIISPTTDPTPWTVAGAGPLGATAPRTTDRGVIINYYYSTTPGTRAQTNPGHAVYINYNTTRTHHHRHRLNRRRR